MTGALPPAFGGNLTRQPYVEARPRRIVGTLANTDVVMDRAFSIALFPGAGEEMALCMADARADFFKKKGFQSE